MAENNTYQPENDLELEASLNQEDVYTPENDLELTQSLISVPTFGTVGASASATGATINLSGITSLKTSKAEALGVGETTLLSGLSTLDTLKATASATGGVSDLLDTGFESVTAVASASGATGLKLEIPPLPTTTAEATATGSQTSFDVIGTGGEISVLIEGQRINTYTNVEVKKRLNEVDTFSFEAFIEEDGDRQLIQEGNEVKIIESYDDLLFKGVLNEVEYKSTFRAKCEGNGMVQKLLNRKTDRDEYSNAAGDEIIKSEVDTSVISYGNIETAPSISVRFDHDNLARAVAGVANATGYDWYIDQTESDDYETDELYFVEQAGRSSVQETFDIGGNAQLVERNKDDGFVANDITLLGRGDGINQLEANVFAASNAYTDTAQIIDENETGSFTVDDATQLGSVGDDLIVRVGIEVMDVSISDSTTLSINSRGLDDWEGNSTQQIKHYENIRVWRLENTTQGIGRFTPESDDTAEAGSSIGEKGVREQRETDKTIVDISTLEKTADLELKDRFEDVFRVQITPTEPRVTQDLQLGDTVKAEDLTAMDVSDEFRITGMDVRRNSSEEGTTLHLANRPRRLTERLSEIESNTDTLNAHMQGATNFNGERFEDNADNTHPLTNKIFVPEDVVAVNKFELNFARESFRGYTESTEAESQHTHVIDDIPEHDHDISTIPSSETGENINSNVAVVAQDNILSNDPFVTANLFPSPTGTFEGASIMFNISNQTGSTQDYTVTLKNESTGDTLDLLGQTVSDGAGYTWVYNADSSEVSAGDTISATIDVGDIGTSTNSSVLGTAHLLTATNSSHSHSGTTTDIQNTEQTTESTKAGSAHSHGVNYGIFEPSSEPDIDVEVNVDGNTVTTVNNVSVGEEVSSSINLQPYLSEPIAGRYHDIELVPIDTGGGNNGRCRLTADITQKVFIESKL